MSRRELAGRAWWAIVAWNLHPQLTPDRVAGWEIGRRTKKAIRIEADGSWALVQIVFLLLPSPPDGQVLVMSTFVMFRGRVGRGYFNLIGPAHRRVAPMLMVRAVSKVQRRAGHRAELGQ